MTNHGNCKDKDMWVIGHNIKAGKMLECYAHTDEIQYEKSVDNKESNGNPPTIKNKTISPLALDLAKRFDIIVKTVYAVEFLQNGHVSDFTRQMYERHLQVWNNFKEPCKFRGQKEWFDASKPCVKKSSKTRQT